MTKGETLEEALNRIDERLVDAEELWASYAALASKREGRTLEANYGASKFTPLIDALNAEKANVLRRSTTRKRDRSGHYATL